MDDEARGKRIQERRLRHGIGSVHKFQAATGVSRGAIAAAEDGRGSPGTYQRLEAWLDRFDDETDDDTSEPAVVAGTGPAETMEVVMEGNFGVKVTVKGPIAEHDMLRDDAIEILRSMRDNNGNGEQV